MWNKKIFLLGLILLISMSTVLSACGSSGSAKNYPSKPITLIVPFAAGGGTDAVARAIAAAASKNLGGASIGIVNKTGGSGAVGMTEGANAKADGYTLTMVTEGIVVLPHLGNVSFTHNDFKPIALINFDPSAVTVRADSPFNTLEELLEYAKQNPGKLQVGTSATNTIWDLALSSLEKATGLKFTHVPYEAGAAPAIKDLLGGHIDAITVSPGEVSAQVKAGELKTLAVMSGERQEIMPDVPTLKELGIDLEVGAYRGITVPKNTPDEIVKKLEEAFLKGAEDEEFINFMRGSGFGIFVRNSAGFADVIKEIDVHFGELLTDLGVKK